MKTTARLENIWRQLSGHSHVATELAVHSAKLVSPQLMSDSLLYQRIARVFVGTVFPIVTLVPLSCTPVFSDRYCSTAGSFTACRSCGFGDTGDRSALVSATTVALVGSVLQQRHICNTYSLHSAKRKVGCLPAMSRKTSELNASFQPFRSQHVAHR